MAVRPVNPPAFDVNGFDTPLRTAFPDAKGNPRPVYSGQHSAWKRWVNGDSEFDGKGLADAVKTNAGQVNTIQTEVNGLKVSTNSLEDRIAALEAQPQIRPFP